MGDKQSVHPTKILNTKTPQEMKDFLLKSIINDEVPRDDLAYMCKIVEGVRRTNKEKQKEGIAKAKLRGVHIGRPKKQLPENFGEVAKLLGERKISTDEALRLTEMKYSTFYKKLSEYRAQQVQHR